MALTRKKKIIIAVSAVAVLALIIIISVFASRKDEAEVTTVKLEVKPELRQTVTASGEVRPIRYIKLTSEVPGRIEEIYVNAGDQVTQGTPLVRVDPTQLQSSQEAQWAAAQQAMNDIQSARNAVGTAQQVKHGAADVIDGRHHRVGRVLVELLGDLLEGQRPRCPLQQCP